MDFVRDQFATGPKIRVLTVVDTFSCFSPVVDPRFSYRVETVVESLDQQRLNARFDEQIASDQFSGPCLEVPRTNLAYFQPGGT
jgi:putative transposase